MALKIEHTCTRCRRAVTEEVIDVKAAQTAEELDQKKAATLQELTDFISTLDPTLLPDLMVIRTNKDAIVQTYLCNDADAKRSCLTRVDDLVTELETLEPRKPKTKKATVKTTPVKTA